MWQFCRSFLPPRQTEGGICVCDVEMYTLARWLISGEIKLLISVRISSYRVFFFCLGVGDSECNGLIYKSRSQGHFSPSTGRRRYFLAFQPLVRETRRWVVPRILHSSISVASLLSSDDIDRFLELASRGGCLVGNTWIYLRLVA